MLLVLVGDFVSVVFHSPSLPLLVDRGHIHYTTHCDLATRQKRDRLPVGDGRGRGFYRAVHGSWSESTERENATLVRITADRFLPTEDIVATEMIFLLLQQLY